MCTKHTTAAEELDLLIAALQDMLIQGPRHRPYGICSNVPSRSCWEFQRHSHAAFKAWPEFSGDSKYPIRLGNGDAEKAYDSCGDKWAQNEYGNARRRLLRHCICYFIDMRKALEAEDAHQG